MRCRGRGRSSSPSVPPGRCAAASRHRHCARAADSAAEQPGELLDAGEALRRAGPAPAGDDDLRVCERDTPVAAPDALRHANGAGGVGDRRRERLDPRRGSAVVSTATACGCTVSSAVGGWMRATSSRLPPQRTRVTSRRRRRRGSNAVRRQRQVEQRGDMGNTSLPRSVPGPRTAVADSRRATSTIASAIARGASKTSSSATCSARRRARAPPRTPVLATSASPAPRRRRARAKVSAWSDGSSTVAVRVLDVDEDAHTTPISRITSTTRGAAAAPSPRISACLPSPSGTTSRSFSSRELGRSRRLRPSGLRCARSSPGTDG